MMRRACNLLCLLLLSGCTAASTTVPAAAKARPMGLGALTTATTQPTTIDLGVCIDGNSEAESAAPWNDVRHQLNRWQTAVGDAKVDANGYALEEADSVCGFVGYPAGMYHVSYEGTAKLEFFGGTATAATKAGGVTRFDIALAGGFRVHVSGLNAAEPFRNLHLLRPDAQDAAELFAPNFLATVAPFSTLRFLDWMQANNSPVVHWSDRATLDTFAWTTKAGVPYEVALSLCNKAHKNAWLCVPDQVDDDFIHQLARLVRDKLDPSLVCYVEYSNEVWNSGFYQFHRNFDAAGADASLGGKIDIRNGVYFYDPAHDIDGQTRAGRRIAVQAKRISDIFRQEFGEQRFASQVRPILSGQLGNWTWLENGLEWLKLKYGDPSKFLSGVAVAPYASLRNLDLGQPQTRASLFAELHRYVADTSHKGMAGGLAENKKCADSFGLPLDLYECGLEVQPYGPNMALLITVPDDPETGQVMDEFFAVAKSCNVKLAMHLSLKGRWTPNGCWALLHAGADFGQPFVNQFDSVRWQAAMRAIGKPESPVVVPPPVVIPPVVTPPVPAEGTATIVIGGKPYTVTVTPSH